jgi:hypothetical protein
LKKKKKKKKKKGFVFRFKESKFPPSLKGMTTTMMHEEPVFLHMLKMQLPCVLSLKNKSRKHTKGHDVVTKVFCLTTILWCHHVGNHPQEELISQVSKESRKNSKNPTIFLATCWKPIVLKKHADFRTFLHDDIGKFFSTKILCTSLHSIFFCHQMTQFFNLKTKLLVVSISKTKFINCGTSDSSRPSMIDGRSRFGAKGRRSFDCGFLFGRFST